MTLSPAGVHLIAGFEGFRPNWYDDGTGVRTIGYGHTGPLPLQLHAPLTHAQGLDLLRSDCHSFAVAVDDAVRVRLGVLPARASARFAALVSLAFNIGADAFDHSHVLRLVNERGAPRDWHEPATAMLAWCHDGNGRVIPGLLARRRVEAAVLVSGTFPQV